MNPHYTQTGVHLPLAAKLPALEPHQILVCRWSVTGDEKGMAGQRTATFTTFRQDPDVRELELIPDEAWDPRQQSVGDLHGIRWLLLSDLHHTLSQAVPVAAVVSRGNTVFVNVMLSATQAHIQRDDGSEQNGTTQLYCSLLNHYLSAHAIRWADDLTRAARSDVGWAPVKDVCQRRHTLMGFGGRDYDLSERGDRVQLGILTTLTSEDDPDRRRKLTGKRVGKMAAGGAAVPLEQMPRGWTHAVNHFGKRIKETDRGFVPTAEHGMMPVLAELYSRYADGATFQELAPVLTDFEARGLLVRRDPGDPGNSYRGLDLAGTPPSRKHDAVQPFFFKKGTRPSTPPTEDKIDAYLAGADPAEIFDEETRTYIGRLELVRTGVYFRSLRNDIKGILRKGVDGFVPKPAGSEDERGTFYVESEPWPWPEDDDGRAVPRFGIPDEVMRKCVARLLRRLLDESKSPRGGRHRRDGSRRLLQNFNGWVTDANDPVSIYPDGPTAWGVRSRTQKSGKNTICIMHRPGHMSGAWGYLPDAASASLGELVADLAAALDTQARSMLDPAAVAYVHVVQVGADQVSTIERRVKALHEEADGLTATNFGLRQLQGRAAQAGDHERVSELEDDERRNKARISFITSERAALEAQREQIKAGELQDTSEGNLNVWAYLVVALERAAKRHGLGSERDGVQCDETFVQWRFLPDRDGVDWSCAAVIPLTDGGKATVPLHGRVRNLRGAAVNQRDDVARYIFAEGRDVDEVARHVGCRRRAVYDRYVMPALRDAGITSTGAKCALVDHPFGFVRKIVWAAAHGQDTSRFPVTPAYLETIIHLYLDPDMKWGSTTVPDDTRRIQRALDLLSGPDVDQDRGMSISELALILDCTEEKVRDLARPRHRNAGFIRPRYMEYTSHTKDRVRRLLCPYDGEPATHVALFPEVAASGFGVLCRTCRRAPAEDPIWARCIFPEEYVATSFTRAEGPGSVMEAARTVVART